MESHEVLSTSGLGFRFVRWFLLIILFGVACMGGLALFLGWRIGMDITVTAKGQIQPTSREVVKSQRPGLIKRVHIKHGQDIEQGTLLISLDDTDLRNALEQVEDELKLNELQRNALPASIERERAIIEMDIAHAETRRATELLHLERSRIEFEFYHEVLPFHAHEDFEHPVDKLIPIREHKVKLKRAEVEIEQAKRRLAALETRRQELVELKQLARKLNAQRRLLRTHIRHMRIYAPVAGTVLTRDPERRIGDWVAAGDSVLELAELSSWQAKVHVPEVDIPKIKIGQSARLYVEAFPHMQYKVFKGTVIDVPRTPEDVSTLGVISNVLFPVKVSIADPVVMDGNKRYSLAYGMGTEAKIVTKRGPIVELVWEKFLKTIGRIEQPAVYRLDK